MNVERLRILADFLDTVPDERFDMARWVTNRRQLSLEPPCGTAACAGGWATAIPAFQKLGLSLDRWQPYFDGDHEFKALQRFFGLDDDEIAIEIFTPRDDYQDSPKRKAAQIRRACTLFESVRGSP